MNPNPYQTQAVETASPVQLVVMLYDRMVTAIVRARSADEQGDLETVNRELQRLQDILRELQITLDHERGGQVAANLAGLYDFCRDRALQANVRKDVSLLDEVEPIILDLREAWVELSTTTAAHA